MKKKLRESWSAHSTGQVKLALHSGVGESQPKRVDNRKYLL